MTFRVRPYESEQQLKLYSSIKTPNHESMSNSSATLEGVNLDCGGQSEDWRLLLLMPARAMIQAADPQQRRLPFSTENVLSPHWVTSQQHKQASCKAHEPSIALVLMKLTSR
jgi:hypothetical protein